MKYARFIEMFERQYNTTIKQTNKGLEWEINGITHDIEKEALGRYKRFNINFYDVLNLITHNEKYKGKMTTAIELTNILQTTILDKNDKVWTKMGALKWRSYEYSKDKNNYFEVILTENIKYSMVVDEINMQVSDHEEN